MTQFTHTQRFVLLLIITQHSQHRFLWERLWGGWVGGGVSPPVRKHFGAKSEFLPNVASHLMWARRGLNLRLNQQFVFLISDWIFKTKANQQLLQQRTVSWCQLYSVCVEAISTSLQKLKIKFYMDTSNSLYRVIIHEVKDEDLEHFALWFTVI